MATVDVDSGSHVVTDSQPK